MVSRKYAIIEKKDEVARVIINDPDKRNRLSQEVIQDVASAYEELRNDEKVVVVITTGAGDIAWSAGMAGQLLIKGHEARKEGKKELPHPPFTDLLRDFPKVTIAAVNGYCHGAAISLLISHDLAIASEERARFGLPEIMRGFPPRVVMTNLVRAVPLKWAFDLVLTGDNLDARTAQKVGLISRVVPHAQLQEAAFQWAKEIVRWDPICLEYCKKITHAVKEEPVYSKAIQIDGLLHDEHGRMNPRAMQGMRDFLAKRAVKADAMAKWV